MQLTNQILENLNNLLDYLNLNAEKQSQSYVDNTNQQSKEVNKRLNEDEYSTSENWLAKNGSKI